MEVFAGIPPVMWVHFAAAAVALPLGLWQLIAEKGNAAHRLVGRFYIPIMLVALVSALASYRPGTPFVLFHILALVGLWSLGSGVLNLRRWLAGGTFSHLRAHKIDMAYSWLGLFMAGVSQLLANPRFGITHIGVGWQFWGVFAAINLLIFAAGTWWIFARLAPHQSLNTAGRSR